MPNPPIQDKFLDFITPQLDYQRLTLALSAVVKKALPTTKQTEFNGSLRYRVLGSKITDNSILPGVITTTIIDKFDINHAVADPFRDQDVDNERLSSKGILDRDTIEKRNVLYVEGAEIGHMLYLTADQEDASNLATFLLRIVHKEHEPVSLSQGSKILFSFNDLEGMRDPFLIPSKEKDQKTGMGAGTKDSKQTSKTSSECKGDCKEKK